MANFKKNLLLVSCAAAVIGLGACTPMVTQRGNMLEDYQVKQIIPTIHTRSDVLRLLGSPTTKSTFNENIWYYIGQETEKHGILDPEVSKERIFAVVFDEEGVVTQITELDGNRMDIPLSEDKTPTHGNDLNIMQEFFGNLGRFNPQTTDK